MAAGLLGFGVLAGGAAAIWTIATGGSLLLALALYSGIGVLAVACAMGLVMLRRPRAAAHASFDPAGGVPQH